MKPEAGPPEGTGPWVIGACGQAGQGLGAGTEGWVSAGGGVPGPAISRTMAWVCQVKRLQAEASAG